MEQPDTGAMAPPADMGQAWGWTKPSPGNASSQRSTSTATILAIVSACLQSSSYAPVRSLHCEWHDGAVVVKGAVSTYFLKQMAQEQVRQLRVAVPILFHAARVTNYGV